MSSLRDRWDASRPLDLASENQWESSGPRHLASGPRHLHREDQWDTSRPLDLAKEDQSDTSWPSHLASTRGSDWIEPLACG